MDEVVAAAYSATRYLQVAVLQEYGEKVEAKRRGVKRSRKRGGCLPPARTRPSVRPDRCRFL
jgi:hypothetical protein